MTNFDAILLLPSLLAFNYNQYILFRARRKRTTEAYSPCGSKHSPFGFITCVSKVRSVFVSYEISISFFIAATVTLRSFQTLKKTHETSLVSLERRSCSRGWAGCNRRGRRNGAYRTSGNNSFTPERYNHTPRAANAQQTTSTR